MSDTIDSANMNLPIPIVGVTSGPDWAQSINSCLTIIDSHDHSSGNGVQITPGGMDINSDLTFSSNNAIALRTARWTSQNAALALATDLNCAYVVSGDLYYNDSSGNQIRITQSGAVAGTPGSISNLVSPASASYSSGSTTFVFQSAASPSAYIDCSSILIRNITASSNALTLAAPAAMGSNYTIVLPTLPVSAQVLSIDSSGNMGTGVAGSVNTIDLAAGSVTKPKLAALGQQVSSASTFSTTSSSYVDVTSLTVTITTTGRPVIIMLTGDGASDASLYITSGSSTTVASCALQVVRDSTSLGPQLFAFSPYTASGVVFRTFPSAFVAWDFSASAGSHTYKVQAKVVSGGTGTTCGFNTVKLVAYEL